MPFGIIDAKHDGTLPGTELLIKNDGTDSGVEADAHGLKRLVVRVRWN